MRDAYHKIEELTKEFREAANPAFKEIINPGKMEILKERVVCDEGCKTVCDLLYEKDNIIKNLLEHIQNYLDKEL